MSGRSQYRFRRAEARHMPALAAFADRYFQSDAFPGHLIGRTNYFCQLHSRNPDVFRMLEFLHESNLQAWKIVGYSSIIPELRAVAVRHRAGQFDQYRLEPSHIFGLHDTIPDDHAPQFYAQAVAVALNHREHAEVQMLRNQMLVDHLASLMRNYHGVHFRILAEAFTPNGRALLKRLGFSNLQIVSPSNHELYRLRSEDIPALSEAGAWLAELNRIRRSQSAA